MREKLIELIRFSVGGCARYWAEIIADYLIANGVIVPPCKVGDTVYSIVCKKIQPFVVVVSNIQLVGIEASFEYKAENGEYPMYFDVTNIGKSVFLTREEADQALKGGDE